MEQEEEEVAVAVVVVDSSTYVGSSAGRVSGSWTPSRMMVSGLISILGRVHVHGFEGLVLSVGYV